jgi:CheY-like chemotaxis protein
LKNILVIDKTPSLRRIREIAEEYGLNMMEATSATFALRKLKESRYDVELVIIDVQLDTEDDGFELIKQIKSDAPSIPIVILTSLGKRVDIIRGLKAGAVDYILKPLHDETIRSRIFSRIEARNKLHDKTLESDHDGISNLLRSELVKARKGKFSITIIIAVFYDWSVGKTWIREKAHSSMTDNFTKFLSPMFFETDYVQTFESNTVIGFLPFCPEDKIGMIDAKLERHCKSIGMMSGFENASVSVAYAPISPDDGDVAVDDVIIRLFNDIEYLVVNNRFSKYVDSDEDEEISGNDAEGAEEARNISPASHRINNAQVANQTE